MMLSLETLVGAQSVWWAEEILMVEGKVNGMCWADSYLAGLPQL